MATYPGILRGLLLLLVDKYPIILSKIVLCLCVLTLGFYYAEAPLNRPDFSPTPTLFENSHLGCHCTNSVTKLLWFPSRMLAKDELIALLQRCVEILQPVKSKKMKAALVQLKDLLAKFKQLDSK